MAVLKSLIRVAIGLALLSYLFVEHEIKLFDVVERALGLPALIILGAIGLDLLGQSLSAYRWSQVTELAGHRVGFKKVFPIYFSGMFFNICLPTSVGGDVVRTVGLGRHIKSKTAALASVFMDRNVGLSALLGLGLVSALLWPSTGLEITLFGRRIMAPLWPFFLLLMGGFVTINVILFSRRLFRKTHDLMLKRLPASLKDKITSLHDNLQLFRLPLPAFFKVFLISLGYQVSEVTCVWLLARGLNLDLPFWVFGALVTFQAVAGLLPITINNIGVRESIFCAVLMGQAALAGLTPDQIKDEALALSLVYFGLIVFSGLTGGLVYLISGLPKATALQNTERGLNLTPAPVAEPSGCGE